MSTFSFYLWDGVIGPEGGDDDLWFGVDPQDPVWIVGILGHSLVVSDVVRAPWGGALDDDRPIEGAVYAWDANAGSQIMEGVFMSGAEPSYASFVALQDEQIQVIAATPAPTSPLVTPVPIVLDPDHVATIVAAATETAIAGPTSTP